MGMQCIASSKSEALIDGSMKIHHKIFNCIKRKNFQEAVVNRR